MKEAFQPLFEVTFRVRATGGYVTTRVRANTSGDAGTAARRRILGLPELPEHIPEILRDCDDLSIRQLREGDGMDQGITAA